MQTPTYILPDNIDPDACVKTRVYGYRDRHAARRLVDALAAIPCLPRVIFKVGNRSPAVFGIVDYYNGGQDSFVKVHNWGRHPNKLPLIEWTADPRIFSSRLGRRAEKQLELYMSGVRTKPMVLITKARDHGSLTLRMLQDRVGRVTARI